MNAEEKIYWDDDDEAFQTEFSEISALLKLKRLEHNEKEVPLVPPKLSRLIRQQAKRHPQEDLSKNWIFGPAMLLVLVILLMFSIGLLFSMSAASNTSSIHPETLEHKKDKAALHLNQ